jgi:hypothetical protein
MASQVTPMVQMLAALTDFKTAYLDGALLRSYSNNYTPVLGSSTGSFTESTYTGYGSITLTGWSAPYDNGLSGAQTDHALQTWTCTGGSPQNIYGIYVTKGGVLVFAMRDPAAPFSMGPGGLYGAILEYLLENIP